MKKWIIAFVVLMTAGWYVATQMPRNELTASYRSAAAGWATKPELCKNQPYAILPYGIDEYSTSSTSALVRLRLQHRINAYNGIVRHFINQLPYDPSILDRIGYLFGLPGGPRRGDQAGLDRAGALVEIELDYYPSDMSVEGDDDGFADLAAGKSRWLIGSSDPKMKVVISPWLVARQALDTCSFDISFIVHDRQLIVDQANLDAGRPLFSKRATGFAPWLSQVKSMRGELSSAINAARDGQASLSTEKIKQLWESLSPQVTSRYDADVVWLARYLLRNYSDSTLLDPTSDVSELIEAVVGDLMPKHIELVNRLSTAIVSVPPPQLKSEVIRIDNVFDLEKIMSVALPELEVAY